MVSNSIDAPPPPVTRARGGRRSDLRFRVAFWWGLTGVVLLFGTAVLRLGERALRTLAAGLSAEQWLVLVLLTAVFVYGEGIRALQRRWVPWMIGRLEQLRAERRAWYLALAPLHAMAMIGAPPGTLAKAWGGSAAIFVAVLVVSRFPEPWRGITDFAVASALLWAMGAMLLAAGRHHRGGD